MAVPAPSITPQQMAVPCCSLPFFPIFWVGPMAPRAPFFATVSQMAQCFRRESFPYQVAASRGTGGTGPVQMDHLTLMMLMPDMNQFQDFPLIKSAFFCHSIYSMI